MNSSGAKYAAGIHYNSARIYDKMNKLEDAIEIGMNEIDIATFYNSIGRIYLQQRNSSEALHLPTERN